MKKIEVIIGGKSEMEDERLEKKGGELIGIVGKKGEGKKKLLREIEGMVD